PPPIGTYPLGSTVSIVERPAGTTIESFAGAFSGTPISFSSATRTLVYGLTDPGTNVPVFINTAAAALAVRADFDGDGQSDTRAFAGFTPSQLSVIGQAGDL